MKKIILPSLFGLTFGFLLQKGGVSKYHILEGQLLLADFTVAKVMASAIVVGMLGFFTLKKWGKVKSHVKPANLVANISGGLIFGVGFACAGYCPGTGAAALGQGDLSALYYIGGMLVGSYIYAVGSNGYVERIKGKWKKGEKTLPDLIAHSAHDKS
jgi:uncharacterized protein